ncbi:hypothetical protein SCRM01_169 [Synechococcus phage S-CRM01]|uniref:hypothetical protein n=1 Tax=Synechococcus phage S-CRM01 TaxID=1026955 RepID=UPI000209E3FA|nr:hypothetical protein SCRM01_169 [Synechococcus phage S-CRM01]AEC53115.1 hypothetical protein SCRM01_169 [Synechococcus phage S-CRM01]
MDFPSAKSLKDHFNKSDYNNNPDEVMKVLLEKIQSAIKAGPTYNITTAYAPLPTNRETIRSVRLKLQDLGYRVWIDHDVRHISVSW